ncbi:MAG: BatD family protein [Desulfobacter sp.]|nr:MAG: BatD family protein [Desulfobacter sp.]
MINSLRKYRFLLILGLVFCLPALGNCFTVTAQVDRTRISPGEAVSLELTVDGGKGEVDLSPITDFEVVSSGTQTSINAINGKWSRQAIHRYMLVPKKTGVLTVPPLAVVRGGERAMTREIRILVSKDTGAAGQPRTYFARASLEDAETVTGQQTVYTLKLYAARAFAGASFDPPGFEGVAARELTQWKKYREEVKGQTYMVSEVKYLIQGESPGTFDIAPAVFVVKEPVGRSRRSADPFDSFFNDSFFNTTPTRPVRVVSNPVTLAVSPLPQYTGNTAFSGLVGDFTMAAALDKEEMKAGESATLTLTVQGQGNIMDAAMPSLNLPEGRFKVYEDSPVEEINATEQGLAGKKIFKRALVPSKPGDVTIGPLSLVFFHVKSNTYKTISTAPIGLRVLPGEPATLVESGQGAPDTAAGPMAGAKQAVVLKNKDILDIREDISGIRPDDHLPLHWFLTLVLVPGLGFAGFSTFLQYRGREKTIAEQYRVRARSELAAAEKAGVDSPEFSGLLQSALTSGLLAKGGKEGASLTRTEAREILSGPGNDPKFTDQVLEVMDTLDGARFGGAAMDKETAGRCLSGVRSVIKTLVLFLCLLPAVSLMPTPAGAADHARHFIDGARAYQAGEYGAAAENFEAIAAAGVKNPDLFYNLGNAYFKAGELGRAVLWYERAKRLAPNDPDLNFNLAHALEQVRDKADEKFSFRDVLFFWQGLVSLKWLQFLSIGASFVFFAWAGGRRALKKNIFSGAGTAMALVFFLFLTTTGLEAWRLNSEHRAVILGETVAVRSGTMETATLLFDLHAGTRVRVLDKKNNHFKIRFAGGKVGWIGGGEAEII